MKLKIKAVSPRSGRTSPPLLRHPRPAAMDLHACVDAAVTLRPGGRAVIPTGIAIALPSADYVALVFARSGLGIKHGVVPGNCVGVIDSDYRGEIMVGLWQLWGIGIYRPAGGPHRPADGDTGGPGRRGAGGRAG